MTDEKKSLWILVHTHRHGIDLFPVELPDSVDEANLPDPQDVIEAEPGGSLELDREDEHAEWRGPWALPLKAGW